MAVTKKSLISNSTSKKTTKKSSPKAAANPVAAAKLATATRTMQTLKTMKAGVSSMTTTLAIPR